MESKLDLNAKSWAAEEIKSARVEREPEPQVAQMARRDDHVLQALRNNFAR